MTDSSALEGPALESPARWCAGEDHGLLWPHGLALVSGAVDREAIERVWLGCREQAGLGGFLELLSSGTGAGLLGLPDFAVAMRDSDCWQVAARGAFVAHAVGEGIDRLIDGSGFTTWAEGRLPGITRLTLTGAGPAGADRPSLGGIVPAGQLTWALGGGASGDSADDPAPRRGIETPDPDPHPDAAGTITPVAGPPAPIDEAPAPFNEPPDPDVRPHAGGEPPDQMFEAGPSHAGTSAAGTSDAATSDVSMAAEASRPVPEQTVEPSQPTASISGPPAPPEPMAADLAGTDVLRLWEETIIVPVEQAAIRANEEAPGSAPTSAPAFTSPRAKGVEEAGARLGDHDGQTMMAADLRAAAGVVGAPHSPTATGTGTATNDGLLLGSLCAKGHANPPQRSVCRQCAEPVIGEPRRVPRPPLGRIRTSTGEVIDLVAPVVIGRNPRADRFQGSVPPRLVALPYGHVSGTHLTIQLEGWNVLAVDQHSSNGTFLRRHGEPPTRLPQSPILLVDGDVLDLGHGVTLTMEALP